MKRLLVIPHHPESPGVRIRLAELASAMASRYEVFLLNWGSVRGAYTIGKRISVSLKDLLKSTTFRKEGALTHVELPTLHRPVTLAHRFNNIFLHRIIEQYHIDAVINGSYYLYTVPAARNYKYLVDLADLPPAQAAYRYVDDFTRREAIKADAITTASTVVADYVREHYGREAVFLPNGFSFVKTRAVNIDDIDCLRRLYGVVGRTVLGYIGFIGKWVDVALAVAAFKMFRQSHPGAVLLWIGAAPDLEDLRRRFAADDVRFIGPVDQNIEAHFRLLDVGLVPTRKTPFQDAAFHIKLVEYTAARIPVVSTRLTESMRLNLPNVLFADDTPASWAEALSTANDMPRDSAWEETVTTFDWKHIAAKLQSLLEEEKR